MKYPTILCHIIFASAGIRAQRQERTQAVSHGFAYRRATHDPPWAWFYGSPEGLILRN
ncbi:MAG TPA: hypothetical protein VKR32_19410 [Puia sp.]|nr:hypothetical protein [Puia sp.]